MYVFRSRTHVVYVFICTGSDPSAAGWETGNGATALHGAVENDHLECVKLLLAAGAKQQPSMGNLTPLHTAGQYLRYQAVPLLAEAAYRDGNPTH